MAGWWSGASCTFRHTCGGKVTRRGLGSPLRQHDRSGDAIDPNRVVALMGMTAAALALFLDVRHFPVRRHLAVLANHATAGERCKTKKTNQTHHESPLSVTSRQQLSYR